MIPHDPDRNKPPLSSRNGLCGGRDPEETGSYPPAASWPPAATVAGGPSTSHERSRLPRLASSRRRDRLAGPLPRSQAPGRRWYGPCLPGRRQSALPTRRLESHQAGDRGYARESPSGSRARLGRRPRSSTTTSSPSTRSGRKTVSRSWRWSILKGMSLAQWLDRGQCPSVEVVLRIGREIAAGLSAAHRQQPDPPRHQAGQHLARGPVGPREDPRFRHGTVAARGRRDHAFRRGHGHAGLYGSRASPR